MSFILNNHKLVTGECAEVLLDLGAHPIAHKFLRVQNGNEEAFSIKLGRGTQSGLVGLIDPPEWRNLAPIYPWIKCNEPEQHLDDIAAKLAAGLAPDATILGLSSKDKSLLERFEQRGFCHTYTFESPLIEQSLCPGVEVVQAALTLESQAKKTHDLILARHILEHTHDTTVFLTKVKNLLAEDGLMMIEVPDNERAFRSHQHTIVWEEHTLYFTESSLQRLLAENGLSMVWLARIPMALEDILVAVVKKVNAVAAKATVHCANDEVAKFCASFENTRTLLHQRLIALRNELGAIAMLGAGHFGASFVNFYGLAEHISAIVDDDKNKQGLYMAGSRLPIVDSQTLFNSTYGTCLLTCNPWNDGRVAERYKRFTAAGGQFLSIFALENWL